MIPESLIRTGSYAVVRTAGRDEDLERIVPLSGEPLIGSALKERKALSFGMILGGDCPDNRPLRAYLDELWHRARQLSDRGSGAALIVIWYVGGDMMTPDQPRERVKVENRPDVVPGASVEVPRSVAAAVKPERLVHETIERVLDKSEALVTRRRLGWSLDEVRAAFANVAESPDPA